MELLGPISGINEVLLFLKFREKPKSANPIVGFYGKMEE
jgi:hypothetical protein